MVPGCGDPFGFGRSGAGGFKILAERAWPLGLADLVSASAGDQAVATFLRDRLTHWLLDRGYTANEVAAVRRANVDSGEFERWSVGEIVARLETVKTLRGRPDFTKLVELTKRVDNILAKQQAAPVAAGKAAVGYRETEGAAIALNRAHEDLEPRLATASGANDFGAIVDHLSALTGPVAEFFDDVLVLDPGNPAATQWRCDLLARVRASLTRDFDIRELAGQADSSR